MKTPLHGISLLVTLFISISLYAQQYKSTQSTHITFGSGLTCEVGTDNCSITMVQKSQGNASISYDIQTQELIMEFEHIKLEEANRKKLLAVRNQTVKDTYQYTFTYDNPLPPDIVNYLGLKGKYYIRKGIYPVLVKKDQIVLRVKLIKK